MTHAELVQIAEKYARKDLACRSVIVEARVSGLFHRGQIPDILGWRGPNQTVKIECKVSMSDAKAEMKKVWHDNPALDVGVERYLMYPMDMGEPKIPGSYGSLLYDEMNQCVLEGHPAVKNAHRNIQHEMDLFAAACSAKVDTPKLKINLDAMWEEVKMSGGYLPIKKAAVVAGVNVKTLASQIPAHVVEQFGARYIVVCPE